ncbi:putative endo-1,4-beta-xylanase A [Echria macrotheca]|uniref:Endo-1,4-beta-xylanase n=1 Tax=Echria macrotheca TaxID=438768 RepID=A0AAJ0FA54_9PEZI|nr:putative endo-1,4-beta-xylanase A [Echria macrotheca]
MVLSLRLLLAGATSALAIPVSSSSPSSTPTDDITSSPLGRRDTAASTGSHNGFYYSFWTDGGGEVDYANGDDGSYTVAWRNCSSFFGGKGWNPGLEDRNITFAADTFEPEGNGYLSVYGWSKAPRVEYYVVENWGSYDPTSGFNPALRRATIEVDGGTYHLGMQRIVQMTTQPDAVITQVWSVRDRDDRRAAGTVTMKAHFDAWREKLGIKIGTLDFQIVSTEGYRSSGEAEVSVEKSG